MTSWAIVAIPQQDDPVWKVSSEKVPHLTIVYLGEQSDAAKAQTISAFLTHISSTVLSRFGLVVDHRGVLGSDDADVLFFDKKYVPRELSDARKYLLQNDTIKEAYNSTEQYPEWTPHLTLGYPNAPANNKPIDYPISYVHFDRLALWTDDFAGFETPLADAGWTEEVTMSDLTYTEMLAHFGVRGMRWGVRKAPTTTSDTTSDPAVKPSPTAPTTKPPFVVIDKSDSPSISVPHPSGKTATKVAVGVGVAIAATAAVALGAAYVSNQMQSNPAWKVSGFGKKAKLFQDAPDLIRTTATRVYDQPTRLAIGGGPKAIESTINVVRPKGSVYNIVSDKKWQKSAKVGKAFTEKVLIGNIGGVSINDLKN